MVSNSAKLDRRTKQHTQFGVSASNGSRDMAHTKLWRKKRRKKNNEANWMVSNSAKLDRRTKQHTQFGVSASNGSRDMARTKSWRKKKKNLNNEANWMVSNSAQLDCRTKQHTQFAVSASSGSRDMAWTKSWQTKKGKKEEKKKNECEQSHKASPTGITNNIKKNSFDFSISKSTLWSRAENKRDRFSRSPENEKLYENYAAAFQL